MESSNKPKRSWLARLGRLTAYVIMMLALLWSGLFLYFAPELPDTDKLTLARPVTGMTILARDGTVLSRRGGDRGTVRLASLPVYLPAAVIATEDRRFYRHFGMDVIGFGRALFANLRAGRVVQGGSTITQQLAKNLYLTPERTLTRKLRELMLAIWLEARLRKNAILEIYLNRVYLGAGSYGVEAASRRYFGKPAREVTLAEAALLAGLLKAPSRYAPTANIRRARARAADVLDNMVAAGFVTADVARRAKRAPINLAPTPSKRRAGSRYFVDWIESQIPLFVGRVNGDLLIETTLDPTHQKLAEKAVARGLLQEGRRRRVGQAALVALGPKGAIRAMVGGRSYGASQYNRAVQARRQPGSAFKPIVYLAGLEAGLRPETRISDAPISIDGWRPRNFDGKFIGPVSLEDALARSINTVAVRLARRVGPERIIATARRLGVSADLSPDLSLALGTSELSLLELATAYLPFANGGHGYFPYGVLRIRTKSGRVLYERDAAAFGRIVDARYAGQMDRMLKRVVTDGTGRRAKLADRPAAGKTGTSQDYRDGWFVGYTGDLVAAVWIGNDDNSPTKRVTGGQLPARIWKRFMTGATKGLAVKRPSPPASGAKKDGRRSLLDEISSFFSN